MYYIQNNDLARWDKEIGKWEGSFPVPWLSEQEARRYAMTIASDQLTEVAIVHCDTAGNERLIDRIDFSCNN